METRKITTLKQFWLRPLQFENTAMHPNVLLMCKLMATLLVAHHLLARINTPFVPFIPALDFFNSVPTIYKITLKVSLIISLGALMLNFHVRTASLIIGSIAIFNILAIRTEFSNHAFICACSLFVAGLTNRKELPWLIYLQLSLVYFGASLNKLLDPDWWSGAFMDNWLLIALENPIYTFFSSILPEMFLAKILSITAMFSELLIVLLLLNKKYRTYGIWYIIIFHSMLFSFTSLKFGYFMQAIMIVLVAFIIWPKEKMVLSYKKNNLIFFRKIMKFLDFDQKIIWKKSSENNQSWLTLKIGDKTLNNNAALKKVLLYTPSFYFFLLGLDSIIYLLFQDHRTIYYILNLVIIWGLIVYFLPKQIPLVSIEKKVNLNNRKLTC